MVITFVILHYLNLEDTIACVDSILETIDYNKNIVIVDNGSNNGSGELLLNKYRNNLLVHTLTNEKNLGFAKGNNIGFKYAKYELKSDFIVMTNNDTIFEQRDFGNKIVEISNNQNFDVCGPKIISLIDKENQNPVPKIFSNINEVRNMKMKFRIKYLLSYFNMDNTKFLNYLKPKKTEKVANKEMSDFQLHGSCMIFSSSFIKNYEGLYEGTFMYLEECILKYICERDNLKMVYSDDITVYHKEDGSTNTLINKEKQKRRFFYKNSIDSCNSLIRLMQKD